MYFVLQEMSFHWRDIIMYFVLPRDVLSLERYYNVFCPIREDVLSLERYYNVFCPTKRCPFIGEIL